MGVKRDRLKRNLLWNTRKLTRNREDHLTYFIAAALEADEGFRAAYAACVLSPLAGPDGVPEIVSVTPQPAFPDQHSFPDMMIELRDGRRVLCEHKIDAPETPFVDGEGEVSRQIERYLELPGIAGLCYFRGAPCSVRDEVVRDPRYLQPQSGAAHFLWDDLYGALGQGRHELCGWLREGFFQLGLTPPDPNVSPLWPDEDESARKNQKDFAKLWRRTRTRFEPEWRIETGSRCQLYLTPKRPSLAAMVLLSPLAQRGNLLMVRVHAADDSITKVRARLKEVVERLSVTTDWSEGRAQNGRKYVDLLAPLSLVLGPEEDATVREARLLEYVAPVIEALGVEESQPGA